FVHSVELRAPSNSRPVSMIIGKRGCRGQNRTLVSDFSKVELVRREMRFYKVAVRRCCRSHIAPATLLDGPLHSWAVKPHLIISSARSKIDDGIVRLRAAS